MSMHIFEVNTMYSAILIFFFGSVLQVLVKAFDSVCVVCRRVAQRF